MDGQRLELNRRRFLAGLSAVGVGSTLLPGALVAVAQDADVVTTEMLEAAQALDFEKAALLRDRIRRLRNEGTDSDSPSFSSQRRKRRR